MHMRITGFLAMMLFFPGSAVAAQLYIDPSEGTFGVGDTFIATVRLLTDECVNAADVYVEYPRANLKAVDFSKGSSIFSLWVKEPVIGETGKLSFAGGIPGGYCGRIQGDPSLSNVLGKIIFTVIADEGGEAGVSIASESRLYAHDGLGTEIVPEQGTATFSLVAERQLPDNEWIAEVNQDTIPPEAFTVEVQSTRGVFGGRYYLVFSTLDKQSGLDHFEIFERGAWKPITSPYELRGQSLHDIQVRAIDKAGNERLGNYDEAAVPELQASNGFMYLLGVALLLVLFAFGRFYLRRAEEPAPPAPSA
jgi:hypothetical protein